MLKSSALGILFPILIALLVPLRFMLGRWMEPRHLGLLDEEEALDERLDDSSIGDFRP